MAAVKSGLETLRDYAIVEFLANRGPGKNEISKTDDALFKRTTRSTACHQTSSLSAWRTSA